MHRLSLTTACLLWLSAVPTFAQDDFSRINAKPGDVVYVTQPSGVEVSGTLTRLTPSTLSIDGYDFKADPGLRIERRGDTIRDGIIRGFLIGAAATWMSFPGAVCRVARSDAGCTMRFGLAGAGLGALIDHGRQGRTLVYAGRRSVGVTFGF